MTPRIALLFVLAACTSTGYHARGGDGGFSDSQLDGTTFQISFQGNNHTTPAQVADFALLRSAEVARDHGFAFFVIKSRLDSSGQSQGTYATRTTVRRPKDGGYYEGETVTSRASPEPGRTFTIACYKEKPLRDGVYEVAEVIPSMSQKYGLSLAGSKAGS